MDAIAATSAVARNEIQKDPKHQHPNLGGKYNKAISEHYPAYLAYM
jgi:hypothetical protein